VKIRKKTIFEPKKNKFYCISEGCGAAFRKPEFSSNAKQQKRKGRRASSVLELCPLASLLTWSSIHKHDLITLFESLGAIIKSNPHC